MLTAVLLSYGLYEALIGAPTEQSMGDVQRIFYYHAPSAWTAFVLFTINFVASVVYLIRRSIKADIIALVTAEVGVVFCTVAITRAVAMNSATTMRTGITVHAIST